MIVKKILTASTWRPLDRPGPRRCCPPRARRPGYYPSRLRTRDPLSRGRHRGHFRRCGQSSLLANPLARKPFPRSERGSDLGAAYRNRTDDLRITRDLLPRTDSLTRTDDTADRTWSADCTGISQPAVPRPVPRRTLPQTGDTNWRQSTARTFSTAFKGAPSARRA
jgi:hypothetical protein